MKFTINTCPKCGCRKELSFSNNPLTGTPICFDCINKQLDYNNIEHGEFFCRTYNLPWQPDLWLSLVSTDAAATFRSYTQLVLEAEENKQNLYYTSTTKDLWARTNKE